MAWRTDGARGAAGVLSGVVLATVLAGCGSSPSHPAPSPASSSTPSPATPAGSAGASAGVGPGAARDTGPKVLVLMEENKAYDEVVGHRDAPYVNALLARAARVTRMDAGYPESCPSLAAYLLITGGRRNGICDDKAPKSHRLTNASIFRRVAEAGRQWRSYAEDLPGRCWPYDSDDGRYAVRHVPATYYVSERARCASWLVDLGSTTSGALHDDLAAGRLPAYSFVTPNLCHDMHGSTPCRSRLVATGDAWLARWMPKILGSEDFTSGRLLVVLTFDEGSKTTNHIPTLVMGRGITPRTVSTPLTHCSLLRLSSEVLGLPLDGCAATVASPLPAFGLRPPAPPR